MIAAQEDVDAEDDALALLAEAGDGSMRDALSIMDQAIASAPHESGRAVLSAELIRDLMGAVPNACLLYTSIDSFANFFFASTQSASSS